MKKRIIAGLVLSVLLFMMLPFQSLAVTGTVTGTNVNARAEPSTSSAVMGLVSNGDTFEVGGSTQDAAGATWYLVTLNNGNRAYIRSDFITITDDAPAQAEPVEQGPVEKYQIVSAPDENGNSTYYLYFNEEGTRIKLSDIEALNNQIKKYQDDAAKALKRQRIKLVIMIILFAAVMGIVLVLFVKLRNELENRRVLRNLARKKRPRNAVPQIPSERRPRPLPDRDKPTGPSPKKEMADNSSQKTDKEKLPKTVAAAPHNSTEETDKNKALENFFDNE